MSINFGNITYRNDMGEIVTKEEFERERQRFKKDVNEAYESKANEIIDTLMNYYKHLEIDTGIDDEIKSLEKEIDSLYAKKDKILELSIQGGLSNEEFYERNNLFNDKINTLNKKLNQLKVDKDKIKSTTDKTKELQELLNFKVNSKSTITKIISSLLDHIVVSKISDDKNNMELNIFLSYKENDKNKKLQPILRSSYEFKRGYDTQGTKRYKVHYQVNCYFCL